MSLTFVLCCGRSRVNWMREIAMTRGTSESRASAPLAVWFRSKRGWSSASTTPATCSSLLRPTSPSTTAISPSMIQEGAALQVTPISNRSGKFVTIDVHSRVTLLQAIEHKRPRGKADIEAVVVAIDRPQVLTQRLSTTLRVPVGKAMLVGGMTFEGQPTAQDPNLYLFVTVAIQELRDDLEDPKAEPRVEAGAEPAAKAEEPEVGE